MFVKILGIIDIIAGLILIFATQTDFPFQIILLLGIILITKSSLGFLQNFGSWIDFLGGIVILISLLVNLPIIIPFIHGALVIQKGFLSLMAN